MSNEIDLADSQVIAGNKAQGSVGNVTVSAAAAAVSVNTGGNQSVAAIDSALGNLIVAEQKQQQHQQQHMDSYLASRFDDEDEYMLAPSDIFEYNTNQSHELRLFLEMNEKEKENGNNKSFELFNKSVNQRNSGQQQQQQSPDFNWLLSKAGGGRRGPKKAGNSGAGSGNDMLSNLEEPPIQIVNSSSSYAAATVVDASASKNNAHDGNNETTVQEK